MSNINTFIKILKICERLDTMAAEYYGKFAEQEEDEKIKNFWTTMCNEEKQHCQYWHFLLKLAVRNMLPDLFEDSEQILMELEDVQYQIKNLEKMLKKDDRTVNKYLIAHYLEFYTSHPVFERLIQFVQVVSDKKNAKEDYEYHIDFFLNYFLENKDVSSEMKLLSQSISRLWKQNKRLTSIADEDILSEVWNRRGFFQAITPLTHLEFREGNYVALMILDIDHLKKVNDTAGHKTGDKIIKFVGNSIKTKVRNSDITGRYGGDEFIVFLPNINPDAITKICEKIRRHIETESKKLFNITVSIGAAYGIFKKEPEKELNHAIKLADDCLYLAKQNGRNKIEIIEF